MGKLNIAHHKSYHPYRRDNIERVRRDEEEARRKEEEDRAKGDAVEAEARLEALRKRAGIQPSQSSEAPLQRQPAEDSSAKPPPAVDSLMSQGHINLFQDLETADAAQATASFSRAKAKEKAEEEGVRMLPSANDRNPWYSRSSKIHRNHNYDTGQTDERAEQKQKRDELRKSGHDPLTGINKQLSSSTQQSSSSSSYRPKPPPPKFADGQSQELTSRLSRETSERQRAMDLIRRKKAEMRGSATPSTVYGEEEGESRFYNRREVEAARRMRERRW